MDILNTWIDQVRLQILVIYEHFLHMITLNFYVILLSTCLLFLEIKLSNIFMVNSVRKLNLY